MEKSLGKSQKVAGGSKGRTLTLLANLTTGFEEGKEIGSAR